MMPRIFRSCIRSGNVVSLFAFMLCAPFAHAGYTVDAKLTGISSYSTQFSFYTGYGTSDQKAYTNEYAVQQYYAKTSHPSTDDKSIPDNFSTFCVEISQNVSIGGTYRFNVTSLESVPSPGPPSGMGIDKANMIRELWGRHFSEIGTDATKAAAFQIAIWNIVYDGDKSIQSGVFRAQNYVSTTGGMMQIAESWLQSIKGVQSTYERNLVGLTSSSAQDQITVATPAPPSWLLSIFGIAGLLGFAAFRRRRSLA